jgi:hypothetical protein
MHFCQMSILGRYFLTSGATIHRYTPWTPVYGLNAPLDVRVFLSRVVVPCAEGPLHQQTASQYFDRLVVSQAGISLPTVLTMHRYTTRTPVHGLNAPPDVWA